MNIGRPWLFALSMTLPPLAASQTVSYVHTDALGSIVAVTDQSRSVIERRQYEPFGLQLTPAVADGPGYAGHVQDEATALTHMQQRYYDPAIGRFLSVDPVGPLQNPIRHFGRYHYANNNPYTYTDPSGLAACPTGTRLCYEARRSEWGTTVQPGPDSETQSRDGHARDAHRSGRLTDGTPLNVRDDTDNEQGLIVGTDATSSNPMQKICWSCSNGDSGTGGRYNVDNLSDGDSPGHTHPGPLSDIPSRGDAGLAVMLGRANYVFTKAGVFAVERTEVGFRVRQIAGPGLTGTSRQAMVRQIDAWNRADGASNSGGVSCSSRVC